MSAAIVFTVRVETDHHDPASASELHSRLLDLLEDQLVNGALADGDNPASGLEITYHLE